MGLDSFKSDDTGSKSSSSTSDSSSNNGSSSDDASSTEDTGSNSEQSETVGGLDSFKTTPTRGGSTNENDVDDSDNKILGIPAWKLVNMSKKERIEAIRDSKIPDFKPDANLDSRWQYNRVTEIQCVCGRTFTFSNKGECSKCERAYRDVGRTVVKVEEGN